MSDQWQTLRGRYRRPSLNGNRRCMRTVLTAAAVPRGPLNIERRTRSGNVGRSLPRIQLWQLQLFTLIRHGKTVIEISGDDFAVRQTD